MRRPLLIEPGPLLVLATGHELEVRRVDAARQPTGVVGLVTGRDPPPVVDLPHDLVASANLFSNPHKRVSVLVGCPLPPPAAGRCLDAVAEEFLPEGHGRECKP
jgi:hypothetical protein